MGLIKAAAGAIGGVMADQWKDFFSCESLDEETLVVKGKKQSSGRSSNKHARCVGAFQVRRRNRKRSESVLF